MTGNFEEELRVLQLRFVGKILAGFTHESKNYLAIIKESAGLMGDMLKFGKSGEEASEHYLEIIGSIEEQIEKSTGLFRYLNRFSHRMDNEFSAFDCNELMEELTALVFRFANQRRVELVRDFQEDLPQIFSNPSLIQFLVFSFFEDNIMRLDKNGRIIIRTESAGGSVKISVISEGSLLDAAREKGEFPFETCNSVLKHLSGTMTLGEGKTTFTFPMKVPDI